MRLLGLRRSRGGQRGQGAIEYLGLVLVVAAIVGALVATGIGAELSEKISAQVCRVTGGGDCGGGGGGGEPGVQAGDQSGDGDQASDDDAPKSQAQIDYDAALKELQDARAAEKSSSDQALEAAKELAKILAEELGITDALDCITKGDMGACTETLINVLLSLVGGAVGKLAAKYGAPWKWKKAAELIKKLKKHGGDLYDGLKGLVKNRKKVTDAEKKLADAQKKLDAEKKDPPEKDKPDNKPTACPARHSFVPGTPVLLADGRRIAIEKVDVGDKVLATDPYTGRTGVRKVEQAITTHDDKHFTRLTLRAGHGPALVTATDTHPFWLVDQRRWVEAGDIEPGAELRTADGTALSVASVSRFTQRLTTHDLTVAGIHTYYVVADRTGLLVHNNDGPASIPSVDNARLQKIVDALYHGVGNAELVGDGSAMAAASAEVNGAPGVEGKNHVRSTAQLRASLQNFLTKDEIRLKGGKKEQVIRSPKDIKIAKILIQAIDDAQLGKYKGHKNYPGLDEC
ncbi:MAG TPA: Hint domain-containing protein [Streptomyces sp.]|uniref:Hint domain-containing protein n=1 Tax=Streptomyces sp. TaxID=1931 RepID=UPI002D1BB4DA|nr:Hint domain-containing protein [Streptomyces sp.]HWU12360.1 Hint domain-containing protein [Streptomyces sp.]